MMKPRKLSSWIALAALSLFILVEIPDFSKGLGRHIGRSWSTWARTWRGEQTARQEALEWVRQTTPRSANFLAPVCLMQFWIEAERPVLVLWKVTPANHRAIEWFDRVMAANGGKEIQAVGKGICEEIDRNYRVLSEDALSELVSRYGLTHYLVDRKRPGLEERMVFSNGEWWIYEIASMPKETRPAS